MNQMDTVKYNIFHDKFRHRLPKCRSCIPYCRVCEDGDAYVEELLPSMEFNLSSIRSNLPKIDFLKDSSANIVFLMQCKKR